MLHQGGLCIAAACPALSDTLHISDPGFSCCLCITSLRLNELPCNWLQQAAVASLRCSMWLPYKGRNSLPKVDLLMRMRDECHDPGPTSLRSSSWLRNMRRNSPNSICPEWSTSYCAMISTSFSYVRAWPRCSNSCAICVAPILPAAQPNAVRPCDVMECHAAC